MNLIAVSVRDTVADSFGQPVFLPTIALAIRSFRDALLSRDQTNPMCAHPGDYDLYHVGQFDTQEGKFITIAHPMCLVKGAAVVASAKESANVSQ